MRGVAADLWEAGSGNERRSPTPYLSGARELVPNPGLVPCSWRERPLLITFYTHLLPGNLFPEMRGLTHELSPVSICDRSGRNWVFSFTFGPELPLLRRKITGSHFVQGRLIPEKVVGFFLQNETIGRSEDRTHFLLAIQSSIRYFSQKLQGPATTSTRYKCAQNDAKM